MPSLSGEFTTKSANHHFFVGSVKFGTWREIWKAWAPPRCRFFVWLASLNCCWTADRLSHHGLDHLERCPLCDHEEETVQHLLTSCVFARSVWFSVLSIVGLQHLTPGLENCNFTDWWCHALQMVPNLPRKGFNSLVVLVAWWICKVGNREWLYFFGIFS